MDQHGQQPQSGQFEVVVLISLGVSSGHAPKLKQFPVVKKYYVITFTQTGRRSNAFIIEIGEYYEIRKGI